MNIHDQIEKFHPLAPKLRKLIFEGKQEDLIYCKRCKHRIPNETYLDLTMHVKGIKTLEKSFELAADKCNLGGYKCEKCHEKNTAWKQKVISKLPNVL